MPTDPRKRQKKLENKAARRKEKKHLVVREASIPLASRFALAVQCPVLDSCIADSCWDQGMGQAMLSRALPNGQVAVAVFLVDNYCLGVKNAIAQIVPKAIYDAKFAPGAPRSPSTRRYAPEAVRKFVEGTVEYARDLGFHPDADYEVGRLLFGDLDPAASPDEFEYGKDGRPYYINGPHDSPAKIREILATLERARGPQGFGSLMLG